MVRLMFSRKWWWTTLLVLGGIGLTVRLGFWQMGRYNQNKAFADHMAAIQKSPSLTLSGGTQPAGLTGMEYREVQASGIFDLVHQIAVRNQVWAQSWGDEPGYILITPLVFPDGSAVMVDRGWIPLKYNIPSSWRDFDRAGLVTVSGIIRLPAKPEMGGAPDPTLAPGETELLFWNLIDLVRLQRQIPHTLLPIYIQQAPDPSQTGMPFRALPVQAPSSAGTNAGYATMWFSFSILLLAGYPLYLRKQVGETRAAL